LPFFRMLAIKRMEGAAAIVSSSAQAFSSLRLPYRSPSFMRLTQDLKPIRAKTQPKVETAQAWEYDFTLGQDYAQVLTVPRKAVLSETRSFFDEEGTEYQYEQYYVYVATSSLGLFGEVYDAERINVNPFPIEAYTPEDYHPEQSGIYIHAGDERINVNPENAADYGWSPFAVPDDLVLVSSGSLNYWQKIIVTELDRVEEGTRVRMEKNS